jgi:hypothetical protein
MLFGLAEYLAWPVRHILFCSGLTVISSAITGTKIFPLQVVVSARSAALVDEE